MLIKSVRIVQSFSKSKIGETFLNAAVQQGPRIGFSSFAKQPAPSGAHRRKFYSTKQSPNTYDGATAPGESSQLHSVKLNAEKRHLEVVCAIDRELYKFPFVWLRDNCQCSQCFHKASQSRTIDWEKFDVNVRAVDAKALKSSNEIEIHWSDGHTSVFAADWLKARRFERLYQQQYLYQWYRPKKMIWSKTDFEQICFAFDFDKILHDDATLKEWLLNLARYGVAMVKNAPQTDQECRRLANRVGFIRKTHYGEEFIVQAKPGTTNVAYLSTDLQLHTDLPYYDYKPGVNLLHCLVQSESTGGANLLADAFHAANMLKKIWPDYFKMLSTVLVNWSDVGEEDGKKFHSIHRAPVICIGRDGEVEQINYSVPQRDSTFTIPLETVEAWYEAKAKFVELIHQEAVAFKTQPGDILTFDNTRLVHGRTAYTDLANNTRYIVGAYLDWDEIYSRLRVLK